MRGECALSGTSLITVEAHHWICNDMGGAFQRTAVKQSTLSYGVDFTS